MTGKDPVPLSTEEQIHRVPSGDVVFRAADFRLEVEDPPLDFSVTRGEISGILSLNNYWNQLLTETLAGRYERFYGSLYLGKFL